MKKLYSISIGIILFLGVGHTLLTPMFYPEFSADMLWFAGTGLALIFLGLLNLIAVRANIRWIYTYVIPANVVLALFLTAVSVAVPEIQAILAGLAAWTLMGISIFVRPQNTLVVA